MKTKHLFIFMLPLIISWQCSSPSQNTNNKMNGKHFDQIIVFGDGLSDMGQWGKLTDYRYPPSSAGFFESRWTNGPTWVEYFAADLGLNLGMENNLALGGATTGFYNINEPIKPLLGLGADVSLPGMLAQVQQYLTDHPVIGTKTLVVLWAGGHDIGSYLDFGQPDLGQYPPANNFRTAVEMLARAGARHFFIGTMPDMGYTPVYFGTSKQQEASALCRALNEGLAALAAEAEGTETHIYLFDGAGVFAKIAAMPSEYGIEYLDAYLPYEIIDFNNPLAEPTVRIPNKEKGLDPDLFMNWWAVSASRKVHKIIADEAIDFLNTKLQ
ncbi:MAG: SGNH/GDSL hydrolase family protein [Bacteroidetes bacterium]|nr:SGNH/GDSL hydrolase family protein [Bacteroidota bacterium]